jgi:hypothetical protein
MYLKINDFLFLSGKVQEQLNLEGTFSLLAGSDD